MDILLDQTSEFWLDITTVIARRVFFPTKQSPRQGEDCFAAARNDGQEYYARILSPFGSHTGDAITSAAIRSSKNSMLSFVPTLLYSIGKYA